MGEHSTARSTTTKPGQRNRARKAVLRRARLATAGLAVVAFAGSLVGIAQSNLGVAQQPAAATPAPIVIQQNQAAPLPGVQTPAEISPLVLPSLPSQPQVSMLRPRMRTRAS